MADEIKPATSLFVSELPEWFLAAAGLIYATGFVVVFTYFESFGIREAGTDFFKVKYVHVGVLCLLIQVIVAIPLYSFATIWAAQRERRRNSQQAEIRGHVPGMILVLNMLATFYIFAMFAPQGFIRTRGDLVPLIMATTLLGFALVRALEQKKVLLKLEFAAAKAINLADSQNIASVAQWSLCVVVVYFLDRYSFRGLGHDLWEMFSGGGRFTTGGYIAVLFVLFNLYIFWRARARAHETPTQKLRLAIWAMTLCLSAAIYYLTVLTFAFTFYAFIPAEKGGGSFVETPTMIISFKGDSLAAMPSQIIDCSSGKCDRSRPLTIIEDTGFAIFVADPNDAGGPAQWREGKRPRIFSISRDSIAAISYNAH